MDLFRSIVTASRGQALACVTRKKQILCAGLDTDAHSSFTDRVLWCLTHLEPSSQIMELSRSLRKSSSCFNVLHGPASMKASQMGFLYQIYGYILLTRQ